MPVDTSGVRNVAMQLRPATRDRVSSRFRAAGIRDRGTGVELCHPTRTALSDADNFPKVVEGLFQIAIWNLQLSELGLLLRCF